MRAAARIGLAAAAALALGLGSAWWAIRSGLSGGEVRNGPWRTSLVTGSAGAGIYTRARVAIGGLLALAPSETIYWNAEADAEGSALEARCDYRVEGEELGARWWSVTAYGSDHFLIPNDAGRYSYSQTTLAREAGGGFVIRVSTEPRPGNWLPSGRAGDEGRFALTLRLYNPEQAVYEHPESVALPHILREGCR